MRHSFIDILACPVSHEPLVLLGADEKAVSIPAPYIEKGVRVSPENAQVGAVPNDFNPVSDLARAIKEHAALPAAPDRNEQVIVWEGILVAPNSGRWYPVIEGIPELLPDSLRNWDRDKAFLQQRLEKLPSAIRTPLDSRTDWINTNAQYGDHYKSSEITLLEKVDDLASFLGPGRLSPFNPHVYSHSAAFIRGFSCCLPQMQIDVGSYVLDSGSGYSWTTEWLMKMGVHAVGLEINRTYLDVGRQRMGTNQPHLVIADAENLPFAAGVFDAVLGFDAFHHIPDRSKAMRQFCRVIKAKGRVVLVEPGGAHEAHEVSQAVMKKFGTMEIGMELNDVQSYIKGIPEFMPAVETFLIPVTSQDRRGKIPMEQMSGNRDFLGWCLYSIEKTAQR